MAREVATRRSYLRVLGLTGMGILAGCSGNGGDGGGDGTDTATATAVTTTAGGTTTITPTATLTPTTPSSGDQATPGTQVTDTTTVSTVTTETTTAPPATTTVSTTTTTTIANTPTQLTKLAADDGDSNDQFGYSVALSDDGTTAIIGSEDDEDPNGSDDSRYDPGSGSAYVFEKTGGSWRQETKLAPDDGDGGDNFGSSVALSGDGTTAILGAPGDDDPNGNSAGSAYIFEQSESSWTQQAKLSADDGDSGDSFALSVAMSSDSTTVIIGAEGDDDPNGNSAGSAYIFEQSEGSWTQQTKLTAGDGDTYDFFGDSVVISDDATTAIIGAGGAGDDGAGAAYVFEHAADSWTQKAKLTADDGDRSDLFGVSAAVSADGATAIIGATQADSSTGSVYVFEDSNGSWSQEAKLTADDADDDDKFGTSVAVSADGKTAVIGAVEDEDPHGTQAGSAYVFDNSSDSWSQESKLTAADGDSYDRFGSSVAMSDDATTAIIGAIFDEDPNGNEAGSAYVFDL